MRTSPTRSPGGTIAAGNRRVALVVLGLVLATACTDGAPRAASGPGDDPRPTGREDGEGDATTPTIHGDGREIPVTPLMSFWNDLPGGGPGGVEDEAAARRQHRAVEEAVATCMREQGFTYVPNDPFVAGGERGDDPDAPWRLPPGEFAARYGYGITTMDAMADATGGRADLPEDPNRAIIEAMSPAERQAYYEALWGPGVQVFDEGGIGAVAITIGDDEGTSRADTLAGLQESCHNRAAVEVFGAPLFRPAAPDDSDDDLSADLMREMATLGQRVERDPRVRAAADLWSSCMADAGHPGIDDVWGGRDVVSQRVEEVIGDVPGATETFGATVGDVSDLDTGTRLFTITRDPWFEAMAALDPVEVQALRSFEIDVAVADHGCRADYDEIELQVRIEVEQAFLDANRAELERYRDRVGLGGVG